jgi:hypothetical protein
MFELFDNETKEMKSFCEDNNFVAYHSGGGCYHYMLNDSIYTWLVNDFNEHESVPKSPNDLIMGGLWLDNVWDEYDDLIGGNAIFPRDNIIKHLKSLNMQNVYLDDHGNINTWDIKFVDMIPLMKKINNEIQKILDKENKINNRQIRIDYLKGYKDTTPKYFLINDLIEWMDKEHLDKVIKLRIGDGFKIIGVTDLVYVERTK